ncbi:MAG: tetratricopeptide repeat protein [Desertifilum sp.]|nr:tetratricopeptide repeat protein [Desertifilum sp.]
MKRKILQGRYLYHIFEEIGSGGASIVYKASYEDRDSNTQICAVKKLKNNPACNHSEPLPPEEIEKRFRLEVKALKKLTKNPQIPNIIDYFKKRNNFYIVLEFIEGIILNEDLMPEQPWDEIKAILFLEDTLKTLSCIHQFNFIHRDINPKNIIKRKKDNKMVVIDFGYVYAVDKPDQCSLPIPRDTVRIQAFGYTPSEVAFGQPQVSSDIYSIGTIAIQALTGMKIEQLIQERKQNKDKNELVLRRLLPNLNLEILHILDKMVRYDCRYRYQSVTEVLEEIYDTEIYRNYENSRYLGKYLILQPLSSTDSAAYCTTLLCTLKSNPDGERFVVKEVTPVLDSLEQRQLAKNLLNPIINKLHELKDRDMYPKFVECFEFNKKFYFVQKFVSGTTVGDELVPGTPWKTEKVYNLVRETLKILEKLHQENIKHLGINPYNLIRRVNDNKLVLVDFPEINAIKQKLSASQNPLISASGSVDYIAPEQRMGNPSLSSDVYAVGLIGLQALTGLKARVIIGLENDDKKVNSDLRHELDRMICSSSDNEYCSASKALEQINNLEKTWTKEAFRYLCKNEFAKAVEAYDKILAEMPDFYRIWYKRGHAFEKWGDRTRDAAEKQAYYEEAIASFQKTLEIQPSYFKALQGLARVYFKMNDYQQAFQYYEASAKMNPDPYKDWSRQAEVLLSAKRYPEAVELYEKTLSFLTHSSPLLRESSILGYVYRSWYGKAEGLYALGRYEEAKESYHQACLLRPGYPKYECGYANALFKLGEYSEAEKAYCNALKRDPRYPEAFYGLGRVMEEFGEYRKAIDYSKKACAIKDRENVPYLEAWHRQGVVLEKMRCSTQAFAIYRQILKLHPDYQPALESCQKMRQRQRFNALPRWVRAIVNLFRGVLRRQPQ